MATSNNRSNKETGLNQIEFALIAAILRRNTDSEHLMKLETIVSQLESITGASHSQKTVRERLEYIDRLTHIAESDANKKTQASSDKAIKVSISANNSSISSTTHAENKYQALIHMNPLAAQSRLSALTYLMGGMIRSEPINKRGEYAYYFEPILNESDYNLIKGSINSNRYLQHEEHKYINDALRYLHPKITPKSSEDPSDFCMEEDDAVSQIPVRPKRKKANHQAALILNTINTLYDAITNKYQIDINYGEYVEEGNKIFLRSKYQYMHTLNPYAIFWNSGQYYLLATGKFKENQNKLLHFRIDRITDIRIHEECVNGTRPATRAPIPESLRAYMKPGRGFQADLYRIKHPLMSYSLTNDTIDVTLHCDENNLSTIIDAFGESGYILGRTDTIRASKNKYKNLPYPNGYAIKVIDVDYNAIKRFCLQMQNGIYILEPEPLRNDVIETLKEQLNIYTSI